MVVGTAFTGTSCGFVSQMGNKMTKDQVEAFLQNSGWKKDRYGHYQLAKEVPPGVLPDGEGGPRRYRVKLQERSVRFEVQVIVNDPFRGGRKEWIRIGGDYYSTCVVTPGKGLRLRSLYIKGAMP